MRVPRHVNVQLQTFRAWEHRRAIEGTAVAQDMNDLTGVQWEDPNRSFLPKKIATTSGAAASAVTAKVPEKGLL